MATNITDLTKNQQVTAEILKPLILAYPSTKITPENIFTYAIALSELSPSELQAGVLRCMRTCKFFPSIAEIMEASRTVVDAVSGGKAKDGDEAWQEVQKAVRYTLASHEPEFSTEHIKQAVDTIGWMQFVQCDTDDMNTLRAQFRGIYESICKRKKEDRINNDVLKLVGGIHLLDCDKSKVDLRIR